MAMTMCGLIQSILVRVPVTAIRFSMSKMADGEWWADRGAIANSVKTALTTAGIVRLKMVLLATSQEIVASGNTTPANRS